MFTKPVITGAGWQSAVPDDDFEAALSDKTAMPMTAGIIRQNVKPKVNPVAGRGGAGVPASG
jgi:hypothetical protein